MRSTWPYLFILAAWQVASWLVGKPLLLPDPSTVAWTLITELGDRRFQDSAIASLGMMVGCWLAINLLVLLAMVSGLINGHCKLFLSKISLLLQPLPAFSLLPIAVMLLGIGASAQEFLVIFSGLWPAMTLMITRLDAVVERWAPQVRNLRWNTLTALRRVYLPAMASHWAAVAKTSWNQSWKTLIALEMTFGSMGSSWSLGRLMMEERNLLNANEIWSIMLLMVLIGAATGWLFDRVEKNVSC
jgi:NitT/TauT family transport system permease protein